MRAYIARDDDGKAFLYKYKPRKRIDYGLWQCNGSFARVFEFDLPDGINPQWSDDEPIEVELKIERV